MMTTTTTPLPRRNPHLADEDHDDEEEEEEQDTTQQLAERSVGVTFRPSKRVMERLGGTLEEHPTIALPTTLASQGLTAVVTELLKEHIHENGEETAAASSSAQLLASMRRLTFRDVARDLVIPSTWTLEKFLRRNEITEEDVMIVEYDLPLTVAEPIPGPEVELSDWLACVATIASEKFSGAFAGSFDGSLVFARGKDAKRMDGVHAGAIKAIRAIETRRGDVILFAASKDAALSVHAVQPSHPAAFAQRIATCIPDGDNTHTSIEALDAALSSDNAEEVLLASGAWDAALRLYQVGVATVAGEQNGEEAAERMTAKGKRRKPTTKSVEEDPALRYGTSSSTPPVTTLRGHTDKLSGVRFGSHVDPYSVFTSSWDQTVKCWDAVRECETATLHATKPCTSLDHSPARGLLATGHPDHTVRLFDARASGDAIIKLALSDAHHGWVSCVSFASNAGEENGDDAPLLASVAYDRTCCVWDVRGNRVPLHVIQPDFAGRLFACAWGRAAEVEEDEASWKREARRRPGDSRRALYIGGTDAHLRCYYV